MSRLKRSLFLLVIALFFGACSHSLPNTPRIAHALTLYHQFQKDKRVEQYAPKDRFEAEQFYHMLEREKDEKRAEHLAYLLQKQIFIAKERVKTAELARTKLQLKEKLMQKELQHKEMELARVKAREQNLIQQASAPSDLDVKMTKRGVLFILNENYFEKDRQKLLISALAPLDRLVDFLKQHPQRKLLIEGYVDETKGRASALDLAVRRAESVAQMLISQGISKDRIETKGYVGNKTDVEITILN